MDNAIVVPAAPEVLVEAREVYVSSIKGEGVKLVDYAKVMNITFSVVDATGKVVKGWWELKGKAAAGVKAEFQAFATALKAAGFADGVEYTYWGRVKDASGRTKAGNIAQDGEPDNLALSLADIKRVLNRTNKLREGKGEAFERLDEIYDDLLVIYTTLGGAEDDLS